MADHHDDDLAPSKTEGFKVGEKKTIDEYNKLDQDDEALNRWKASLGLAAGDTISDPSDPRKCIIHSLALEVEGRPDITIELTQPGALENLKKQPFIIKEGSRYQMKATFKVQHEVLSGLKYVQVVKRKGIRVDKHEEMIGSFAPNTTGSPTWSKKFAAEEAPSGMIARGKYDAVSRFVDDDMHDHLKFEWTFEIAKDWA
ncbi:putative rho-gdp dissociation inhibitor [Phaeomoniella chlamydospora]|uniref:Rho GDP-dissociation inhibitor n=1 Tax=Phaeomoniella chlamydospora TaxID=158046 RepID=A0A0G2G4E4_PHACM|nr:putative rho-gdp dissociation inhibitor [Phaeomoniella chlamydospora]